MAMDDIVVVEMNVTEACWIRDVDVKVAVDHPEFEHLIMTLTSPSGITAGLVENSWSRESNVYKLNSTTPITFDDASPNDPHSIGALYPDNTTFHSQNGFEYLKFPPPLGVDTLTDMNDCQTNGTWTFRIGDYYCFDVGTLQSVEITIEALC